MIWTIGFLMAVAAYAGLHIPASLSSGLRESVINCIESQTSTSAGSSTDWKTVIVSCLTRSIDEVRIPHLKPRLSPALRGKRSWHCDPDQPGTSDASAIASNAVADDKGRKYASEDEQLASLAPAMGHRRPKEDDSDDVTMDRFWWRHHSTQAEESDQSEASAASSNAATDDEDDATISLASYASSGSDIVDDTLGLAAGARRLPARGDQDWLMRSSGPAPRREPRAQTSMMHGCSIVIDGELLDQLLQQVCAIEAAGELAGQPVSLEPTWPATTVQDDGEENAFHLYPEALQAQQEAQNDATANDAGLARVLQQEYHNEAARDDELYARQLQQEEWGTQSGALP
ncbi:Uncharacterized protein PBTT_09086 [Plasmodiophora brassicae]